ncbi:imelysin family protein [Halomonas sp. PR-M31]|uniref:imelysin family protein n=1 Tax=Halomonas sp. PR-M31 TaxID=1471202 RepID=UPI000650D0C9|nr:imelysin family protein [Halomonas sp. PR-M31]
MTLRRSLLALLATSLLSSSAWADDAEPKERWYSAIGGQYQALQNESTALADTLQEGCQNPDTIRDAWLAAYKAWQRVRYVDFGPIEQRSRAWQLQFWPDRKNLIARKVDAWLKAPNPPTPEQVAADSVALKGFPALEYLLFESENGNEVPLESPQGCALAGAIGQHLATTTQALNQDWQAFEEHYLSTEGYTETTVESALHGLQILDDKRLAEPMGLRGKSRNGYLADAWRSSESIALIAASLAGLEQSFLPGAQALLQQESEAELGQELEETLSETRALAESLPSGLAPALEDEQAYKGLQRLYVQVEQLRQLMEYKIAPALDIKQGFNSSDGD